MNSMLHNTAKSSPYTECELAIERPKQVTQWIDELIRAADLAANTTERLHQRLQPLLRVEDNKQCPYPIEQDANLVPVARHISNVIRTLDDMTERNRKILDLLEI
jgi:hypothetical protein